MAKHKKKKFPGSIYQNRNRWWWKVRLPGEDKFRSRPLKPPGAKFATKDKAVAFEVARQIWERAIFYSDRKGNTADTIAGIAQAYLVHAEEYYRHPDGSPTGEIDRLRWALTPLVDYCPALPAEDFGPLKLKEVREQLIEKGLSRNVINNMVGVMKRLFKWVAAEQLVPANVYHSLQTVDGLRRGRCKARETEPVLPVPEAHVRAVLPFTTPTVAAMIELQLLTGMRSGELVAMRSRDIETSGKVWLYRPPQHKTAHHGYSRVVPFGPLCKGILRPFLKRKLDEYCFSPIQSEAERLHAKHKARKTPMSCGNKPGTNRSEERKKPLQNAYDTASYRKAVKYAIKAANEAKVEVPEWTPHQLRHTAATRIRKELSLDAARAMLGHHHLKVTDDYAELDQALATEAALKLG